MSRKYGVRAVRQGPGSAELSGDSRRFLSAHCDTVKFSGGRIPATAFATTTFNRFASSGFILRLRSVILFPPPTSSYTLLITVCIVTPSPSQGAGQEPNKENNPLPKSSPEPKYELSSLALEKATNIGKRLYEYNNVEDNYGNSYLVAYELREVYSAFTYETLLDAKYSTFTGTFFVKKGSTYSHISELKIILDGKTIFAEELSKTSRPLYVNIDITGGNDFKITTSYASYPLEVYVANGLFNP